MQSPGTRETGHGDHDYVARRAPVVASSYNHHLNDFEPGVLPERRSRRLLDQIQRMENTDHDYIAIRDASEDGEIEALEDDEAEPEVEGEGEMEREDEQEEHGQFEEPQMPQLDEAPPVNEIAMPHEPVQLDRNSNADNEPANAASVSGNPPPVINSTSPSVSPLPPKKRKRYLTGTPKCNTPQLKSSSSSGDADEEDDGLTCPICLDTWEMSGEHRLVSLRCGHLFGDACIRRWLVESARQSGIKACPQCKAKAATRDIRCLYAKRLRAIDRSEEHRLREQLEDEMRRSQSLQTELAALKMTHKMVAIKIKTLESENDRMKQMLRTGGGSGFSYEADLTNSQLLLRLQSYKLFLERNIEISREPGCRVLIYTEQHSAILASQKSAQGLFPGYGVRFIDTPTFRTSTFLHTSAKLLRDICLNADQQLLAVASMETRCKLFDLRSRQVVSVFDPSEKALWACAMDRQEREHFLYLGGSNGSTYVYDVRFPETVVEEFKTEGDFSTVVSIAPVAAGKTFPCGGFLVCKLQSIWFYEYTHASGTATPTRLCVEGPFSSMNFDAAHDTLLVSARCSVRHPQSRYILGKLEKVGETPVFNVKVTFSGSKATPVMTRCTQLAVEANTLVASYIQDAKLLALFDARREQRVQSLPVQEVVYDICPVYMGSTTYMAALTETKCRMYKLTSTSSPT